MPEGDLERQGRLSMQMGEGCSVKGILGGAQGKRRRGDVQ